MSRKDQILEQIQRIDEMFADVKKAAEEDKKFVEQHKEVLTKYSDLIPILNNMIERKFSFFLKNQDQDKIRNKINTLREFQKQNQEIICKYADISFEISINELEVLFKEAQLIDELQKAQQEVEKKEKEGVYYG